MFYGDNLTIYLNITRDADMWVEMKLKRTLDGQM